jgi:hypothetical protein
MDKSYKSELKNSGNLVFIGLLAVFQPFKINETFFCGLRMEKYFCTPHERGVFFKVKRK